MAMIIRLIALLGKATIIGLIAIAYKVGIATIKMVVVALKSGARITEISVTSVVGKLFNKEVRKIL